MAKGMTVSDSSKDISLMKADPKLDIVSTAEDFRHTW